MKVKCTPELGTVKTNIVQRTIGRAVSIDTHTSPIGPASSDLLGDTFHCLYGMDFEPLKDKEAPETRRINHALMKWLSKDEQFTQTRLHTAGKLILSLTASKTLYEYLMTDDAIRAALEVQEEPPHPIPMPSSGQKQEDDDEQDEPQPGGGSGSGEGDGSNEKSLQDAVQDALDRLNQIQNNVIGSQIMSNAAKQAEESAKETEGFLKSWGIDPGDVNIADVDEIMKLVNGNSPQLERIAELAGRFENICANALEKTRESYIGQIVDVHRTQDFSMMFPPELCYLISPDVPPLLHARYVSDYLAHGLLGFELRSEGKEFGSLLLAVDGSGSMSPESGGFEVQAKAIAIGLARALQKDKLSGKEYKLFTFGADRDPFFEVTSDDSMPKHFEWAEKFQGGGTNFDRAFHHAVELMKNMPSGTDFGFITDGECVLTDKYAEEWRRYKADTNARLLYVDVSGRDNSQLHTLSDMYMLVKFDKEGNMDMIAESIADTLATSIERARLAKLEEEKGGD